MSVDETIRQALMLVETRRRQVGVTVTAPPVQADLAVWANAVIEHPGLRYGVMIGAIMGLTGAGGGILAVPVLVGTLNWPMQTAAPVALIAVASGALVGAIDGFRLGLVRYKAAMLMALCGVPLTRLGQHWAQLLPHEGLMIGFGVLLWGVSARFFKQSSATLAQESSLSLHWARIHGETGKFIWTPVTALVLGSVGSVTGLMTGLLGVGGGFLIVPLMRRFTNLSMAGIVATEMGVALHVTSGPGKYAAEFRKLRPG